MKRLQMAMMALRVFIAILNLRPWTYNSRRYYQEAAR